MAVTAAGRISISVVVPSMGETYPLADCLAALNAQTVRSEMEIVVSLDGYFEVGDPVTGLADRVITGPHGGPAAARNRGWRDSTGEFVLFTDSDCIPDPSWAERMVDGLRNGADAVKGVYSRGGDAVIQRLAQVEFEERYSLLGRNSRIDMVDTYSAGYRREVLEETGGFDESFPMPNHEDVELSYRMAASGKVMMLVPDASVAHIHRSTWAGYFRMKYSRGFWRVKVLRSFPSRAGGDSYTPVNLKLQIALCLLLPAVVLLCFLKSFGFGAAWLAVFVLTITPLARICAGRDPALLPLLPLFVLWRGCALSSGLMRGIFSAGRNDE